MNERQTLIAELLDRGVDPTGIRLAHGTGPDATRLVVDLDSSFVDGNGVPQYVLQLADNGADFCRATAYEIARDTVTQQVAR